MGPLQGNHTSELSRDISAWSSASYSPVPQTYSPALQTRVQESSWTDRSCLWKALCHALRSCQQLGYFFMTDYNQFIICLIVPNHIGWSLGKVVPRAGHLQEQGKIESWWAVRKRDVSTPSEIENSKINFLNRGLSGLTWEATEIRRGGDLWVEAGAQPEELQWDSSPGATNSSLSPASPCSPLSKQKVPFLTQGAQK